MWQEEQAHLLSDEIDAVVASLSRSVGLRRIVEESIKQTKQAVADNTARSKPWSLLPMVVCECISGLYDRAIPAAASLALLKAAADVFDDIEDADNPASLPSKYGVALTTNAATALVMLAEKTILRLRDRGVDYHTVLRVMDAVNSRYLTACEGQHLDLNFSLGQPVSEEEYIKICGMKSAVPAAECACHTGALLAGASDEMLQTFTAFGYNLGLASQIANDIQGIMGGTDIRSGKYTLPLIHALATSRDSRLETLRNPTASLADTEVEQMRRVLFETGAMFYTTVKMEAYRQKAAEALDKAGTAGVNTERLREFLA